MTERSGAEAEVAMEYKITAADRDRALGHEGITAIGNNQDGWSVSAKGAMLRIERGLAQFYVEDALSGEKAYIAVVREEGKPSYLRTTVNGRWANHLLPLPSLKECKSID
ncbi:MAG TPA: DUF3892 domain-containing protein [Fimbriimonadaceae bacterium]|nr:DUF3892 domain-containing protein [Fimbriimonadaceae bacterium]